MPKTTPHPPLSGRRPASLDRLDAVQVFFGGGILSLRPSSLLGLEKKDNALERTLGSPVCILQPGQNDLSFLSKSRFGPLLHAELPLGMSGVTEAETVAPRHWAEILRFDEYTLGIWIAHPTVVVIDIVNTSSTWNSGGADVVSSLWQEIRHLANPAGSDEMEHDTVCLVRSLAKLLDPHIDSTRPEGALLYSPRLLFIQHTWASPKPLSSPSVPPLPHGAVLVPLTRGEFLACWDGCAFWDSGASVESYRPTFGFEVRMMNILAGIRYTQVYFAERCAYDLCQTLRTKPIGALKPRQNTIRETMTFMAWLDTASKPRFLSTEQDHVSIGVALLNAWRTQELLDSARPSANTIEMLHNSIESDQTRRSTRLIERLMLVLTTAGMYQAVDSAIMRVCDGEAVAALQALGIALAVTCSAWIVLAWYERTLDRDQE